jgi:hypothetical protein
MLEDICSGENPDLKGAIGKILFLFNVSEGELHPET